MWTLVRPRFHYSNNFS